MTAAGEVARAAAIPLIGFSNNSGAASSGVYLLNVLPETETRRTLSYAKKLGRKSFARPLKKTEHGTYVKVRFSLDGQQIAKLRLRFKHNEDCLRLQIVSRNERVEVHADASRIGR